jgi:dsRNA-specific ribonuclease
VLDAASIKAHLHHFCNTLPKQPLVETSPYFSIEESSTDNDLGLLTARVILPNCVGSFQRSHSAERGYRTEKAAFEAAAYECYRALRQAELVNENLLPRILALRDRCRNLDSLLVVDEHIRPWRSIASAWSSSELYKSIIEVETDYQDDFSAFRISLITPVPIPTTCWSASKHHTRITSLRIGTPVTMKTATNFEMLRRYKQKMATLYPSMESHPKDVEQLDFVFIFDLDEGQEFFSHHRTTDIGGIMARIIDLVEKTMIADQIQSSLLQTCTFQHPTQIVAALTAPSADVIINFERLEFLGDAILKTVVSAQTFTERVHWPAGLLSQYRDTLISNSSLANAAFSLQLDHHIMTQRLKTRTLAPPRISDSFSPPGKRKLSSKTLADVLQALVAAAYLDSGFSLARLCIKVFIPEIRSESPTFETPRGASFSRYEMEEIQSLIGYQFRNITFLLQALTHPSSVSHGSEESYLRLAFLGDAILGFLVTEALFLQGNELPEGRMTKIKAAILNSNMLGYVCMTHSISRNFVDIEAVAPNHFQNTTRNEAMQLWKYMRHESQDLIEAQKACKMRYHQVCKKLQEQLQAGLSYPWLMLAKLQPECFYSDLIQSVFGAIYVDSGQDMNACQRFLDTLGISSHLQRMVRPDFDVTHPRNALQNLAPNAEVRNLRSSNGNFRCEIMLHEVEIASVESCRSKSEASILTSHRAIQLLLSKRTASD